MSLAVSDGRDSGGGSSSSTDDELTFIIKVIDVDEPGILTLTPVTPAVAVPVTAAVSDGDGNLGGLRYEWMRSTSSTGSFRTIQNAIGNSYVPTGDDVGHYLNVRVTYRDNHGPTKRAEAVTHEPVYTVVTNQSPLFSTDSVSLSVKETARRDHRVGVVTANDPENDRLSYTVSGRDAETFNEHFDFALDGGGAIKVKVADAGPLDFETKRSYNITINVSDGLDAIGEALEDIDDSIDLTITVTAVDEPPVIIGPKAVDYAEDRDDAPAQYAAYDPERRTNVTLSLEGRDASKFTLGPSGVLAFRIGVDHERQAEYQVTIKAVDDANKTTTLAVTINVTNVDEPPLITGPVLVIVDEHESATSTPVGAYTATDPESGTITWSLAGADADSFEFTPDPMNVNRGALVKLNGHNYENPGDANGDNTYVVTLQASDSTHTVSRPIRFVVTDVNETPVMTQPPAWTIRENWTGLVGTFVVTDDLGSDLIWTLTAHEIDGFALRPRARSSGAEQRADLFAERPLNFEEDPSRNLMVQVSDGNSTVGRSLMVSLTDLAEPGTLTLAPWRPRVGAMYRAELSEPDMIIGTAEWSWELATNSGGPWTLALGSVALSNDASRITPLIEDVNQFLRVTVTYTDRHGTETLQAVSPTRVGAKGSDPNTAPVFSATIDPITIREDARAGTVVTTVPEATDIDGDSVYYTLSDNPAFVFDSRSRQVRIAQGAMLDHESISVHYFTVNAVDDRHEGTALQFEVRVDDVNERPVAVDQWVTTKEDEELRIDLPPARDPDNTSTIPTFMVASQPPNGEVTETPGQTDFTYTPRNELLRSGPLHLSADRSGWTLRHRDHQGARCPWDRPAGICIGHRNSHSLRTRSSQRPSRRAGCGHGCRRRRADLQPEWQR